MRNGEGRTGVSSCIFVAERMTFFVEVMAVSRQ